MEKKNKNIKILKYITNETRFKILIFLLKKERCVCEIFPHVKKTQSTVSIHLKKLENLNLVKSKRTGKKIYYQIKDKKIKTLLNNILKMKY
ncbi:metalloregulator ArsR/SmtB family transcription factor [Candidatus Micrarchaeota archaeon]|jgi:ArsR family transcriptional regulator|nr:metalloregulator ArsR/SmtB family transcription factor [Candidatus Micrarchaeota archaeon]